MTDKDNTIPEVTSKEAESESRRSFLKKAGMFALYTPPAITMLMKPGQASIMSSPGGHQNNNGCRTRQSSHRSSHQGQGGHSHRDRDRHRNH